MAPLLQFCFGDETRSFNMIERVNYKERIGRIDCILPSNDILMPLDMIENPPGLNQLLQAILIKTKRDVSR